MKIAKFTAVSYLLTGSLISAFQAKRHIHSPVRSVRSSSTTSHLFTYRIPKTSTKPHEPGEEPLPGESAWSHQQDPIFEPPGAGIRRDVKARLPFYKSDIKDGLNVQCFASTIFLFFACLSPAIAFGSLYSLTTGGTIGTVEMLLSCASGGVLYSLFAAQPLTILGGTGPVLAFVACLMSLAKNLHLPFLPLYAWTGLWTSGILFGLSLTSGSNLVRYFTRFTDEIFSLLISFMFVLEAVSGVSGSFSTLPFSIALLTTVCATSTYMLSTILKNVRKGTFFTKRVRETVSTFGPTIGVITSTCLAHWALSSQGTILAGLPALDIPTSFGTTNGRPWLVPLGALPVWARYASVVPALMATVLLFLSQNITVRLVNNPKWYMKKGRRDNKVVDGMHLDLMVVSLLTAFQSLLGLPWLVAATVRTISHVNALAITKPSGEVVGIREQRVTGTVIHSMLGMCILLSTPRKWISQLPLAVLTGLFMYLGVSSLPGNEMYERMLDTFRDRDLAPTRRWSRRVSMTKTHIFTGIQVACLGALFAVIQSPLGVLFPIIIAMLAPLRAFLEKSGLFNKYEMEALDAE